jgi:hypothetical protein
MDWLLVTLYVESQTLIECKVSECASGCVNECTSECVSGCVSEYVSECVSGCVSECMSECVWGCFLSLRLAISKLYYGGNKLPFDEKVMISSLY